MVFGSINPLLSSIPAQQRNLLLVNLLTDINQSDPISGFPIYKSLLCEIAKVVDGQGTGLDNAGLEKIYVKASEGKYSIRKKTKGKKKRVYS